MSSLFGTDGIRGRFGDPPLDQATVRRVGLALAQHLQNAGQRQVVVGGDTRQSTPTLARWLAEGLEAGAAQIVWVGVVPTPGVAWLCSHLKVAAGVAVSASHNPAEDNGIKLLTAEGGKWPVAEEARIEALVSSTTDELAVQELSPTRRPELVTDYVASLRASVSTSPDHKPFSGVRLTLDTSHGAASALAGPLFESLGADVEVLADEPDGLNINRECGSTHPESLARRVVTSGRDFGIAFDGDADRAILVDENGVIRDGDAILYLWGTHLANRGQLPKNKIVATTMSNLGLEVALAAKGIELVRCGVGDRTLVETLEREGLDLGGEQSGHIVRRELSTTGDGLLTALHLTNIIRQSDAPLSQQLAAFQRYPQVLVNQKVGRKPPFEQLDAVQLRAQEIEQLLGDKGRLLLRYSGTEPLARVMIEGEDQHKIESLAHDLARVIAESIG